jgi:hypothetical protein
MVIGLITDILLTVALNTTKQTNKQTNKQPIVNFPFIYVVTFQRYLHIYGKAEYYKKNRIKNRERVGTPLTGLPPSQMCTCPVPRPDFPKSYAFVRPIELR